MCVFVCVCVLYVCIQLCHESRVLQERVTVLGDSEVWSACVCVCVCVLYVCVLLCHESRVLEERITVLGDSEL